MLPLHGVDFNKHPTEDVLEAYVMRTLSGTEIGPPELHPFLCLVCRDRLAETAEFITAMRAAAAECLKLQDPRDPQSHRFTHDTDDGLIVSQVTRLGPKKWLAHHWGPQLDGGRTTRTLREAVVYLIESFQQMFPEHVVCTTRCMSQGQRTKSNIVPSPADS